jgi:hypothetical protein
MIDLNPIRIRKTAAKIIRKDPTSIAHKPTRPFLIRIKELPQTIERITR